MPPIELFDEAGTLEPEPDGVPNPEDEDDADAGEVELELEPDGVPNPEAAAEPKAGFDDINPLGTFIPAGGWPPTLVLGGTPGLALERSETCEPPSEPVGCPG
jgi:hypothetical protein